MEDRPAVLFRPEAPVAVAYRELTQFLIEAGVNAKSP